MMKLKSKRRVVLKKNILTGLSQKSQSQEDNFLESLTRIALPEEIQPKENTRASRFWIKTVNSDIVEEQKVLLKPKSLDHVDKDIEDRLAKYKLEIPKVLNNNIVSVREFFLREIAPLTMASSGGTLQSREVASRLLDTDIDSSIFGRFDNMVNRAAVVKMAIFVLKYFDLPEEHFGALIGNTSPGGTTPIETEVKKIMEQLHGLPSRRDIGLLSQNIKNLSKVNESAAKTTKREQRANQTL